MKTQKLVEYMKARVLHEKVKWEIPDEFLENMFVQKGTRIFFGVVLDDLGNIICDKNQPEFFQSFSKVTKFQNN